MAPDPARFRQLRALLDELLDLDPQQRPARLAALDDPGLRAELESLLASLTAPNLLDRPAAALLAERTTPAGTGRDWAVEQIGRTLGPWRIEAMLGTGGMGTVYSAVRADGRFEQRVAIKLVMSSHPGLRLRFQREQRILAQLEHPNIARLLDAGESGDGTPYLVMEYVEGQSLAESHALDRAPLAERLSVLRQLADALSYAHRRLVIHRDIKPSNVMIGEDGRCKLLDFGISKLIEGDDHATAPGIGPMTPAFAAPEQFRGEAITVATDLYQFAVLAYRLMSGAMPYRPASEDPMAWAAVVQDSAPERVSMERPDPGPDAARRPTPAFRGLPRSVRQDLDAVFAKALAKGPERRHRSIDAFIADIEAALASRPISARRHTLLYRGTRALRRHWLAASAVALAFALVSASAAIALRQAARAEAEARRAGAEAARAETEVARTRRTVSFLASMFDSIDLAASRADQVSARAVLDAAAAKVDQEAGDDPTLRAEIHLQLARAYRNAEDPAAAFGQFAQALALLDPAQAARAYGDHQVYADAAGVAARTGHHAEAEAWLRAGEQLPGDDEQSVLARATTGMLSAWMAREQLDFQRALQASARAWDQLSALDPDTHRLPRTEALFVHANNLLYAGTSEAARAALEQLDAELDALEAKAQRSTDAHVSARLRTLAGTYRLGARRLAASLDALGGRADAAVAALEALDREAAQARGERSTIRLTTLDALASARLAAGDARGALGTYQALRAHYAEAGLGASTQAARARWGEARSLSELGDTRAALVALRDARARFAGLVPDDAVAIGKSWAEEAAMEHALGNAAAARAAAQQAMARLDRDGRRDLPELRRAQALLGSS